MSGDISRDSFRRDKHFDSVRMQQGKALLDADINEQCEIVSCRNENEATDVIGSCGAPLHRAGFRIVRSVNELTEEEQGKWKEGSDPHKCSSPDFIITAGHYYVDGILCENDHNILFSGQPDLPEKLKTLPWLKKKGLNLAYLDCWKRTITSVEDPYIREVALGGPDTATRLQTVWQVKTVPLPGGPVHRDLTRVSDQWESVKRESLIPGSQGGLQVKVADDSSSTDACSDLASGGYTGLGNQRLPGADPQPRKSREKVQLLSGPERMHLSAPIVKLNP